MTLPEAIAAPRASQRNGADDDRRAGVHRLADGQALDSEYGHSFVPQAPPGEIGVIAGDRVPARGKLPRRDRADAARRRQREVVRQATVAKSSSTGSRARASSTTASASASCLDGERAGGDRRDADVVGPRAGDVARGVADHHGALARPVAGAGAGDARQLARATRGRSRSRPGRARSSAPIPARPSLSRAIGSRLPVTSESRNSSGRAASASSSSGTPGATRSARSGGHSAS